MADMCGAARTKKYDIPLSHLDFNYVKDCTDSKELEKILKVLRSGEEGRYPDLETVCEDRLTHLKPESKVLRKEIPASRPEDLDKEDWEKISESLQDFTSEMKQRETIKKVSDDGDHLPPVRGTALQVDAKAKTPSSENPKKSKSVKPRDYREWDKFDIEKELKAADNDVGKTKDESGFNNTLRQTTLPQNLHTDVKVHGLSEEEKSFKANREKDKGNEAFRSNDYAEAVVYYTRSIKYVPLAASYNNRALAYIKQSKWKEAVSDCNKVLNEETDNIKAILRRGSALKGLREFDAAEKDFQRVLEMEPNNKHAKDLLRDLAKQRTKEEEDKVERKKKGRRMMIEEVDGSDEEKEKKNKIIEITESKGDNSVQNSDEKGGNSVPMKDDTKGDNSIQTTEQTKEVSQESSETKGENCVQVSKASQAIEETNVNNSDTDLVNQDSKQSSPVIFDTNGESSSDQGVIEENGIVEEVSQSHARPVYTQLELPADITKLRETGNGLFRSGQYGEAIEKYSSAIDKIASSGSDQTVNLSLLYSNRAACRLKTGDCSGTIEDCTLALELVPHSIKPLMRRAQAYETTERYPQAYIDFKHILNIDSSYTIAHQAANRCSQVLKDRYGSNWRDKIPPLRQVSLFDIPIIEKTSISQSSSISSLNQISSELSSTADQTSSTTSATPSPSPPVAEKKLEEISKPLNPDEEFDMKKAEGNKLVQKGEFGEAIDHYSSCIDLFPDRAVGYTNRALCYLRLNQATKAEEDCSKALSLDHQNVKALFRRAQARKVLCQYKDSLTDLTQLLKLDSKNSAALREIEVVKKYYREELEKLKSSPLPTQSKEKTPKSNSKQRRRLVIEEVEGETTENQSSINGEHSSGNSKEVEQKDFSSNNKKKGESTNSKDSKTTSKKKTATVSVNGTPQPVKVPKLIKVTPYEFMQAWNSLKMVKAVEPYAKLLEQVPPKDIAMVISNKLDAHMLTKIISSAAQYFVPKGETDLAYHYLNNLTQVPRLATIAMFMSKEEKQELSSLFEAMTETDSNKSFSKEDLSKLKTLYGLKS